MPNQEFRGEPRPKQKCLTCSVPEAGEAIGIGREAAYPEDRLHEIASLRSQ
jgi:hypothetical protein